MRELRKQLAEAVAGNENFASVREEVTLGKWFDRWMEIYKEKSIRPNTKREYTHIYNKNISPYIGNRKINFLVKSNIQQLIDQASDDNYAYERQNKIKIILRDMLQRAVEDNLIINNPVSGIKLRADKEIKAKSLTLDEQNVFFNYCGHTFRHTFATRCFENGVDAKVVQSYLRHASLKMTMDLYTHVTDDKSAMDIEKIVPQSKNNVVDMGAKWLEWCSDGVVMV